MASSPAGVVRERTWHGDVSALAVLCRHGSAVFRSHLFGSATVVTSDAEVSRFVLQSDARAFVPWYPRSLTELMGKSSILLINGSLQRRVHGLVGAFFKSPQLKAQVTAGMQRRLAPALAAWRAQGPGARVRIQDQAKAVRAPLLCRLCHYLYLTALQHVRLGDWRLLLCSCALLQSSSIAARLLSSLPC